MPELCRFLGIVIQIHPRDHPPPHFHATYGDAEVVISIATLMVIRGRISQARQREVLNWAGLRQTELHNAWEAVRERRPVGKIAPPD